MQQGKQERSRQEEDDQAAHFEGQGLLMVSSCQT